MAYLAAKTTIEESTGLVSTTAAGHMALHNDKAKAVNSLTDEMIDARNPELATPAETATSVPDLLGQLKEMLKNITGESNWYDGVAASISTIWSTFREEHSSDGAHTTDSIAEKTAGVGVTITDELHLSGQPRSRSRRSGTQSINNTSDTIVTFDTEDYDIGGIHDNSSNYGRVTIPIGGAGIYSFKAGVAWANNDTGFRTIDIIKGGTTVLAASTNDAPADRTYSNVSGEDEFSEGDFIEVRVRQNSGGSLTILGDERTFFAVSKIA